jgi:7-cyano-7-deazaguanine synthase
MPATPLLVLSSGGLHSLIAAGVAARDSRVALLHINDGRATAAQAAAAFDKQTAHFKPIKHWTIATPFWRQMSLPPESASVVHATSSDSTSPLIPLRELQLLSIAAGFARQIRASAIVWGIQIEPKQTDHLARGIELVQVLNQAIDLLSIDAPISIRTPLMGLEDSQVIELGYQMSLPFTASWTCQTPGESPCMSCPACARRIRAFRAAQLVDPLITKKSAVKE